MRWVHWLGPTLTCSTGCQLLRAHLIGSWPCSFHYSLAKFLFFKFTGTYCLYFTQFQSCSRSWFGCRWALSVYLYDLTTRWELVVWLGTAQRCSHVSSDVCQFRISKPSMLHKFLYNFGLYMTFELEWQGGAIGFYLKLLQLLPLVWSACSRHDGKTRAIWTCGVSSSDSFVSSSFLRMR